MAQLARVHSKVTINILHILMLQKKIMKSFQIAVGSQHYEMTTVLRDRRMPISESASPKFEDDYHETKVARDNKRERHTHPYIYVILAEQPAMFDKRAGSRRCLKWLIRETHK